MSCATSKNLLSSLSFTFFNRVFSLFTIKLVLGLNKTISVNAKPKAYSYLMIRKCVSYLVCLKPIPFSFLPGSRPITSLNQLAINWSAFYPFTPAEIINSVVGFVCNTLLDESFYTRKKNECKHFL